MPHAALAGVAAPTRTNVDWWTGQFRARVGNPYVYAGVFSPGNVRQGCDCSALAAHVLNGVLFGPAMTWQRVDPTRGNAWITTESWRPIEVGQRGPFGTITVARPQDIPADAAVKIALHHGPGGGANSHMWLECDGVRMESAGSKGCCTQPQAWPIDHPYGNDWAYLPGPIGGSTGVSAAGGLTPETLSEAMGGTVPLERYRALLPAVRDALAQCDCRSLNRIAMWLAQIGHESVGLKYMSEIWGPTAAQLGYEGRIDLGNTQPGDGYRFRGRGPIQVTGRRNYTVLSLWAHSKGLVPTPTYFVDRPDELATDRYGFYGAIWYWTTQRPLNELSDAGDIEGASVAINGRNRATGRANGIDDRIARWNRCRAMGLDKLTIDTVGDDMAQVPQDQWDRVYAELTRKHRSRSPLRHLGEGEIDTWAGIDLNDDGHGHIIRVKSLAEIGHAPSLDLLAEVAGADPAKYPDRQSDAALARLILARIEATTPEVLKQYVAQIGASK